MKKLIMLLMAFFAIISLTECEKSESKKETEPVIAGCWKLMVATYASSTYQQEYDLSSNNEYLCLNTDGSYELSIPFLECAIETGTYSMVGDVLHLYGGCGDLKILTKTESDLKIRWNFSEGGSGYHDFTFKKQ